MRYSLVLVLLAIPLGCGSSADSRPASSGGSSGAGGTAGSAGSSGTGGVGASGGTGGGSGGVGGSAGMAGATGGSAGSAGSGGSSGAPPTCDAPPAGAAQKAIADIWTDNPTQPAATWVSGVFITAISGSKCSSALACQLFVQSAETFASLAAGAHQALRVLVFPPAVSGFTTLAVGDKVDLYGSVWRHTAGGQNELYFEISSTYPGCMKAVGSGTPTGIPGVALADLTLDAYETTLGPLLVKVDTVSGKPKAPNETFGLWESFQISDAGIEQVVSLSPYFLPNSAFVGLTPAVIYNFSSVTGVFGLFQPQASPTKYKEIYVRSMSDMVIGVP